MGWGSTVALTAAAALLVSLPMLLVSRRTVDPHEQESRRMFVEWKARYRQTYRYAGEEECRYAVFTETRRRVARARAAGVTSSGLNGYSATVTEEMTLGFGVRVGEGSYEEETRRTFVEWKAKYGKTYRDAGEEDCRYMLFKGNRRRFVVRLNATAGQNLYGLNQFGDLTNEEVLERCYLEMEDRELRARCQAAAPDQERVDVKVIRYQINCCYCGEACTSMCAVRAQRKMRPRRCCYDASLQGTRAAYHLQAATIGFRLNSGLGPAISFSTRRSLGLGRIGTKNPSWQCHRLRRAEPSPLQDRGGVAGERPYTHSSLTSLQNVCHIKHNFIWQTFSRWLRTSL